MYTGDEFAGFAIAETERDLDVFIATALAFAAWHGEQSTACVDDDGLFLRGRADVEVGIIVA